MLLLYIPGIIAMIVGTFAFPIAVFEGVSATEAMSLAWAHVRKNAGWHVGVWLILFVLLVAAELTVVGLIFIWPLLIAYQLVAYEKAFGSAGALATREER